MVTNLAKQHSLLYFLNVYYYSEPLHGQGGDPRMKDKIKISVVVKKTLVRASHEFLLPFYFIIFT